MPYKRIMVALANNGNEIDIIDESVRLVNSFSADLVAIHVNDPHAGELTMMMEGPGKKVSENDILKLFNDAGHQEIASRMEVIILTSEVTPLAISELTDDVDLLILGHRRMSTFKERFFDSLDEGIINHVKCPVLVIPKD